MDFMARLAGLVPALFDHAHAIHRRNPLERLDGAAVQVLVGVEHGVGVLAGGLVGHALHVGVVLGQDCRDLTDHVGHVGVQAGDAACGARLAHAAGGVVDAVRDVAVLQVILELADGHVGAVGLGLAGAGARVRGDKRVGHLDGLGRGKVTAKPAQLARAQGGVDGVLVNDGLARVVDQHGVWCQQVNLLGANHADGVCLAGYVHREIVAAAAQVLERAHALHLAAQHPRVLDGNERIVAVDVHAQIDAGVGDLGTHVAQADDADALALELAAHKGLLGLLGVDLNLGVVGVVADPVHRLHHAAARKHQHAQDELLDGVAVGAGGVKDDDALLGVLLDGDVVDAGAAAGDGANALGQLVAVQVGRAHQDGVGLLGGVHKLVALAKLDFAVFGDVVDGLDLTHGKTP